MRPHYIYIIGVVAMFLMSSCGKQHDAEKLIDDFIEKNAIAPQKIANRNFSKIDSTKLISDSLLAVMQARSSELYKDHIAYPEPSSRRMLYFVGMHFTYDGDTLRQTFYLDEALTQVVAFK